MSSSLWRICRNQVLHSPPYNYAHHHQSLAHMPSFQHLLYLCQPSAILPHELTSHSPSSKLVLAHLSVQIIYKNFVNTTSSGKELQNQTKYSNKLKTCFPNFFISRSFFAFSDLSFPASIDIRFSLIFKNKKQSSYYPEFLDSYGYHHHHCLS